MRISNIRVPHLGQDGATMTFGGNWNCAAIFSSRVTEAERPTFPSLHPDSDYCHRMTLCAAFTETICGKTLTPRGREAAIPWAPLESHWIEFGSFAPAAAIRRAASRENQLVTDRRLLPTQQ